MASKWASGPPGLSAPLATSPAANNTVAASKSLDAAMMDNRFLFVVYNLMGQNVQVRTVEGKVYQGFFASFHLGDSAGKAGVMPGVILHVARMIAAPAGKDINLIDPYKQLIVSNVVDVVALHAEFREGGPGSSSDPMDKIGTDSGISGAARSDLIGRELEAVDNSWLTGSIDGDMNSSNGAAGWDQFSANAKLFGVKNTYNEEMYTTKLDTSALSSEQRNRAATLAKEILSKETTNVHIAEERGLSVNDHLDEEDRFSKVISDKDIPTKPEAVSPSKKESKNTSGARIMSSSRQDLTADFKAFNEKIQRDSRKTPTAAKAGSPSSKGVENKEDQSSLASPTTTKSKGLETTSSGTTSNGAATTISDQKVPKGASSPSTNADTTVTASTVATSSTTAADAVKSVPATGSSPAPDASNGVSNVHSGPSSVTATPSASDDSAPAKKPFTFNLKAKEFKVVKPSAPPIMETMPPPMMMPAPYSGYPSPYNMNMGYPPSMYSAPAPPYPYMANMNMPPAYSGYPPHSMPIDPYPNYNNGGYNNSGGYGGGYERDHRGYGNRGAGYNNNHRNNYPSHQQLQHQPQVHSPGPSVPLPSSPAVPKQVEPSVGGGADSK